MLAVWPTGRARPVNSKAVIYPDLFRLIPMRTSPKETTKSLWTVSIRDHVLMAAGISHIFRYAAPGNMRQKLRSTRSIPSNKQPPFRGSVSLQGTVRSVKAKCGDFVGQSFKDKPYATAVGLKRRIEPRDCFRSSALSHGSLRVRTAPSDTSGMHFCHMLKISHTCNSRGTPSLPV